MLLLWDCFTVTKPLSQIQKSTLWPLQDANPTPSLGGFGLNRVIPWAIVGWSAVSIARALVAFMEWYSDITYSCSRDSMNREMFQSGAECGDFYWSLLLTKLAAAWVGWAYALVPLAIVWFMLRLSARGDG